MREIVKKAADFVVRIPMRGRIGSLNVSVAVAVALFEVARWRDATAAALAARTTVGADAGGGRFRAGFRRTATDGAHVQHRPNLPAGAADGTLALPRSALTTEGCNSNRSCDLAAVELGRWDLSQDRFAGTHEKLVRPGWQQDCSGARKRGRFSQPDVAIMIAVTP